MIRAKREYLRPYTTPKKPTTMLKGRTMIVSNKRGLLVLIVTNFIAFGQFWACLREQKSCFRQFWAPWRGALASKCLKVLEVKMLDTGIKFRTVLDAPMRAHRYP